ncbi:hypothetical protein [Halosolutus gelatinilyticus]|nr:hypothetical protein [Halosolutus gelatinilyticus]
MSEAGRQSIGVATAFASAASARPAARAASTWAGRLVPPGDDRTTAIGR